MVEGERSTRRFLQVLWTLLTQNRALLLPKDETRTLLPTDPPFIGWRDDDFLYLIPEAAHQAVVRFCRDSGDPFPIRKERVLRNFAKEEISECDRDRNSKVVKMAGQTHRVLKLNLVKVEILLDKKLPDDSKDGKVTKVTEVTAFQERREAWHTE